MNKIIRGTLAAFLLAMSWTATGAVRPAAAATCTGAQVTQICNGTASPASGTTATTFTFSMVYQDAATSNQTARWNDHFARVTINGIGTFDMAPTGPVNPAVDLPNGVTVVYKTKLPVGTYTYTFSGGRSTINPVTRTINNPTPPSVSVSPAPTPKPTPKPTPRPTPRATPRPTPRPTPKPTPKPTAAPAVQSTATATASPSDAPTATASPTDSATLIAGVGGVSGAGGDPGAGGGAGGDPLGTAGGPPAVALPALLALLCGAAGFLFFLARRRRRPGDLPDAVAGEATAPGSAPAAAGVAPAAAVAAAAIVAAPRRHSTAVPAAPPVEIAPNTAEEPPALTPEDEAVPFVRPDEANMPRWRRPSLKEARFASERAPSAPAPSLAFAAAAATGAERRFIRYDLVRLGDAPDEIKSREVGQLQANDQVEVVERRGNWVLVRTPVGVEGWLHRTTLGDVVGASEPPSEDAAADDAAAVSALDALTKARALPAEPAPEASPPAEPTPKRGRARRPAAPRSSTAAG